MADQNGEAEPVVGDAGDASVADVKTEMAVTDSQSTNGETKSDPTENGTDTPGRRSSRNVQRKSLAEFSGSDSDDGGKPAAKRARTSGGRGSRGRGVPKNMADPSKVPQIVLKNLDEDDIKASPTPTRGRGRPRGRGSAAKASGGRGRGRPKAKAPSSSEEEDEEEEEEGSDDDFEPDDDEEELAPKKKKSPTAGRGRGRGRGRPRGGGSATKKAAKSKPKDDDEDFEAEEEEEDDDEDEQLEPPEMSRQEHVGAGDPNSVQIGEFLIEKVDLRKLENYPVWRMEGPNMIRKFEMMVNKGKIQHKSLYAYSSWAQVMLEMYTKIAVTQISFQDGETVIEIKKDYVPQPPQLETLEGYSADPLFESYCTLLRALFQQALDSGFLKQIQDSNDPGYIGAISTFDSFITSHVERIESLVGMRDEFKNRVKNCPNMKSIKRQNWAQTDQATVDKNAEKGVRSVLMFGYGYEPFLMTEEKTRGVEVAQEIVIGPTMEKYLASYHGLFHYKYSMMKRCKDKVNITQGLYPKMSNEECLNKCMEDRCWLLMSFEDLKLLMNYEASSEVNQS